MTETDLAEDLQHAKDAVAKLWRLYRNACIEVATISSGCEEFDAQCARRRAASANERVVLEERGRVAAENLTKLAEIAVPALASGNKAFVGRCRLIVAYYMRVVQLCNYRCANIELGDAAMRLAQENRRSLEAYAETVRDDAEYKWCEARDIADRLQRAYDEVMQAS